MGNSTRAKGMSLTYASESAKIIAQKRAKGAMAGGTMPGGKACGRPGACGSGGAMPAGYCGSSP